MQAVATLAARLARAVGREAPATMHRMYIIGSEYELNRTLQRIAGGGHAGGSSGAGGGPRSASGHAPHVHRGSLAAGVPTGHRAHGDLAAILPICCIQSHTAACSLSGVCMQTHLDQVAPSCDIHAIGWISSLIGCAVGGPERSGAGAAAGGCARGGGPDWRRQRGAADGAPPAAGRRWPATAARALGAAAVSFGFVYCMRLAS